MTFYFGAHMPVSNIIGSLAEIKDLGGNFMQVFVNNKFGKYNGKNIEKYNTLGPEIKRFCQINDMKIVIHSPYVLNFGQECAELKIRLLKEELVIADSIGAIGCVIHCGKYLKGTTDDAIEWMKYYLNDIIEFIKTEKLSSKIILETSAGQGTELFPSHDHTLIDFITFYTSFTKMQRKYFKLCIDTCHVYVAGYNIGSKQGVNDMFLELEKHDVLKDVIVIHFNDTKKSLGSCVDRHEAIGHGFIGHVALAHVLRIAKLHNIPCVLETPDDAYVNEIPWMFQVQKRLLK